MIPNSKVILPKKEEMIKNTSEQTLLLFDRLHKKGVIWLFLWIMLSLFLHIRLSHYLVALIDSALIVLLIIVQSVLVRKVYIKRLLEKKRNALFYLIYFMTIFIFAYISIVIEYFLMNWLQQWFDFFNPFQLGFFIMFFPYLVRVSLYIGVTSIILIEFFQEKEEANRRESVELKNEKLDMELRYLKSQINPHFLFNALNNIYSLVYTHDAKAPESVLKLSEMLRYVMVDCQAETLSVRKEIRYINNYIDFQCLRMETQPNITFNIDIDNQDYNIPPMIFQPLVENSFKHSRLENDPDGFIKIDVVQKDKQLKFSVVNSVKTLTLPSAKNAASQNGIGLANVRKRLELYFGNHFSFETKQTNNLFTAIITMMIK